MEQHRYRGGQLMGGIAKNHPVWASIEEMRGAVPPAWIDAATAILSTIERGITYSFGDLRSICDASATDEQVVGSANFLTNCWDAVFDIELFLKDETGRHVLTSEQVVLALDDTPFCHPVTGELINEPQKATYLSYRCKD